MVEYKSIADINSDKVLLIFGAKWCAPCKLIQASVDKLDESTLPCKLVHVDIETNQELVNKYNITNIPTIVYLKDGKYVKSIVANIQNTVIRCLTVHDYSFMEE